MRVNRESENGFTLVELLAVIVILAVILAIAIPTISNITNASTKNAFESDAKMLLQQLEYKKLENDGFDVKTFNIDSLSSFNLSKDNYNSLGVSTIDNRPYIVIEGKNKWQGLKACGTRTNMKIVPITDTTTCENVTVVSDYEPSKGVNKPKLAQGMTPIKWNGTTWVNTTESDTDWYNYTTTDKKWANAKTTDGSFWVWIPRYIYKISSGWHSSTTGTINVQFSKGTDDNWNNSVIGNIDTGTTANASNNKWTNHPAFTFGTNELTGFWVLKFEASNNGGKVKSVPSVSSWRNITVNNIFTVTRAMETDNTYGWGTTGNGLDTHMMKNTEWGAVAYLSQSTYGKNAEIWVNNSVTCTTGCAGSIAAPLEFEGCENAYDTANGLQASTTGNIYGVYDMAGGSLEYMSSYVDSGDSYLNTNGSSILAVDSKYKDVYEAGSPATNTNNYPLSINKKGDALYETSSTGSDLWNGSWNNDGAYMPWGGWFARGGPFSSTPISGVFYFVGNIGHADGRYSFRAVLSVGEGL